MGGETAAPEAVEEKGRSESLERSKVPVIFVLSNAVAWKTRIRS